MKNDRVFTYSHRWRQSLVVIGQPGLHDSWGSPKADKADTRAFLRPKYNERILLRFVRLLVDHIQSHSLKAFDSLAASGP